MSSLVSRFKNILLTSRIFKIVLGDFSIYGLKKYLRNTGWMMFARIGTMLISFLTTLYIARELGPTNYGELSYAVSFVALFSFIASLGLDNVLYRELIKHPEKRDELLGSAFLIRIISAATAIVLTVISVYILSAPDVSRILIIILSFGFIFQSFNVIGYEFQAKVRVKSISILSLLVGFILNALKIAAIYTGQGVIYLALILLLEGVLFAVGYVYLYQRTFSKIRLWKFERSIMRKLIIDSWPYILTGALTVLYTRADQVMLKNLVDGTTVGIYDAAVRLCELWYFIPGMIAGSLLPAIINGRSSSHEEYRKRTRLLLFFLISLSVCVAVFMSLFAQEIILLVYGKEFIDSVLVLRIYIWSLIPTSVVIYMSYVLLVENARILLFFSALLGAIINIGLNTLLIPNHQATGAAVAALLTSVVVAVSISLIYHTDPFGKVTRS